ENLPRLLIGPIVQHLHNDVGIAAWQRPSEEVATLQNQSTADCLVDHHTLDDMRLVKENTPQFRCGLEYGLEQMSQAAANVANRVEDGEIIHCDDWRNGALRLRLHARMEDLGLLRMFSEIRKDVAYCALAAAYYLLKCSPALPEHGERYKPYISAHGLWMVAAQRTRQCVVRVFAAAPLEYVMRSEQTQYPVQSISVGSD